MLEQYILKEGNLNKCNSSLVVSATLAFLDESPKKKLNLKKFE